jgi:hypothetical protein
MEESKTNMKDNNKLKMIQDLLKKQILSNEKKIVVSNILTYLEHQQMVNEDDVYLQNEIDILYECIL